MPFTMSRRQAVLSGLASAAILPVRVLRAQTWPSKPIKLLCAYPAGGITDLFARAYGDYIAHKFGQTVIVENKTGGGGSAAALALKAAPPDGYTLMVTISTTLLGNRLLYRKLPYDADKDFAFISLLPTGHFPLVVHKSTGATNIKEFVEYARKNKISFGSYAAGSLAHVECAEFNRLFDLDMVAVNFRGEAPMWQDLAAGVIQAACGSYQGATIALDSGIGRAIAVPTTVRMKKLPDVPTFLEQGLTSKAFQLVSWACVLGPANLSKDTVEILSTLMVEAGKSQRIQQLLDTFGIDDAATDSQTFRNIYETQGPIWLELIRKLGVTPE